MLSRNDFKSALDKISLAPVIAVDTETQGLRVWGQDKLFSIIIATPTDTFYFNFQEYPLHGVSSEFVLNKEHFQMLHETLQNPEQIIYLANAKFDLAALYKAGVEPKGNIQDVLVMARLIYNDHLKYDLASCAQRMGLKKSEAVEEYIRKEHLWVWETIPGKKQRVKRKFFDKVPPDIIVPYGKLDAQITLKLGLKYAEKIKDEALKTPVNLPSIERLHLNENLLTKTCFEMEKVGVQIDREYCEKAYAHEMQICEGAKKRFTEICGQTLVDSNKALAEIFTNLGTRGNTTEKGNPSFTDSSLETLIKNSQNQKASELAGQIQKFREAYKKATTYYQGFIYFADENDSIHANIRQAGTTTGRFSYGEPNLQNIPKEKEGEFQVRKAFVPRPGFIFVEFDFSQMEYRLMAEYAGEMELIEKINRGYDVHEATAEMMKVTRQEAKTLNFMLLYGGGAQKLADALGLSLEDAKALKEKYFSALPKVKKFIFDVTRIAQERGFIFNWMGRRCYFPDKNFAYKAPNALIQGGCAEIVKLAMNEIAKELQGCLSRMVLQVHDSILFEMYFEELHLAVKIKEILENAYPAKYLRMTVDCAMSTTSWADMVDTTPVQLLQYPSATKTRNQVQEQDSTQA